MTNTIKAARYASVNGLNLYYEIHGEGQPLILIHGGLSAIEVFGDVLHLLARGRQVIAVDLQAHGRTADIDRPLSYELMADDIGALIEQLGLGRSDVLGNSLGGGVALQTAIRHPDQVRKLVVVSAPFRRAGWYPDVLDGMGQLGPAVAESMKQGPLFELYARIAPGPQHWPILVTKVGNLLRQDYDWSDAVAALKMPALIVFADADSISPAHAAQFFELLGGGKGDAGWDGAGRPTSQLAILPGMTHYTIFSAPALVAAVVPFLDAENVGSA